MLAAPLSIVAHLALADINAGVAGMVGLGGM